MSKPVLNTESALEMLDGEVELYCDLLTAYHDEEKFSAAEIYKLIDAGKQMEAGSLIHRLKGASATIGAESLQEVCQQAERILRGKEEGDAMPLIPIIEERFQLLIPEIEKALQKLQ